MAQVKMTFFFPALLSSRLPQSLQNMSEPMADILTFRDDAGLEKGDRVATGFCGETAVRRAASAVATVTCTRVEPGAPRNAMHRGHFLHDRRIT